MLLATGAFELHAMHRSDMYSRIMPRASTVAVMPEEEADAGPHHTPGRVRSAGQPPSHEPKLDDIHRDIRLGSTASAVAAADAEAETVCIQEGSGDGCASLSWLRARPYGLPTERDLVCEALWRPVYRTLLVRTGGSRLDWMH